jgi:hypothetical protein
MDTEEYNRAMKELEDEEKAEAESAPPISNFVYYFFRSTPMFRIFCFNVKNMWLRPSTAMSAQYIVLQGLENKYENMK